MSIERYKKNGSLLVSKSASGAAGKAMVVVGVGGIFLYLLAMLIPFVGVLGLSGVLVLLGAFMAE